MCLLTISGLLVVAASGPRAVSLYLCLGLLGRFVVRGEALSIESSFVGPEHAVEDPHEGGTIGFSLPLVGNWLELVHLEQIIHGLDVLPTWVHVEVELEHVDEVVEDGCRNSGASAESLEDELVADGPVAESADAVLAAADSLFDRLAQLWEEKGGLENAHSFSVNDASQKRFGRKCGQTHLPFREPLRRRHLAG